MYKKKNIGYFIHNLTPLINHPDGRVMLYLLKVLLLNGPSTVYRLEKIINKKYKVDEKTITRCLSYLSRAQQVEALKHERKNIGIQEAEKALRNIISPIMGYDQ